MLSIGKLCRIDSKDLHDIASTLVSEYGDNVYIYIFFLLIMLIAAVPAKINSIRKFGNSHVPLKLLRKVEREQYLGNCALE